MESVVWGFQLNSNMFNISFTMDMLSSLVKMHSGNTYFRWISMIFLLFTLFFSLTRPFIYENVYLTCLILKWPRHIKKKKNYTNKSIFSMIKVSLSGSTIYLRLLSMKGCDAFQPNSNCFISMIISVAKLSGF